MDLGLFSPTDEYISAVASEYMCGIIVIMLIIVGLWLSVDFVPNKETVELRF